MDDQDARRALVGALARVGDRAPARDGLARAVRALLDDQLRPAMHAHWESIGYGLVRCGTELPHKAAVYAAVAAVLTAPAEPPATAPDHPPMLASFLVTGVRNYFAQSLRDGHAGPARRALRFLGELVVAGVADPASFMALVESILHVVTSERDLDARSPLHARPTYLADTALSALPWVAAKLAADFPDRFQALLDTAHDLADLYGRMDRWAPMFATPASLGDPAPFRASVLDYIDRALLDLRDSDYQSPTITRILPLFQDDLGDPRAVEFSPVAIPAHSKTSRYAPPRFWWSILPADAPADAPAEQKDSMDLETDKVSDPGPDPDSEKPAADHPQDGELARKVRPADAYFVRELVTDILDNFFSNHALAAQHISDLPLQMPIGPEIVQSVFSAMCSLPAPNTARVYYTLIFVDMCRLADSKVPKHLLAAINAILAIANALDPEEFDRLTEWFGHHLSNYKYKFNWHDWNPHAADDACRFKKLFCQDVLARCCRLTFVESFKQDIPEALHPLLPAPVQFAEANDDNDITPQLTAVVTGKGHLPSPEVKNKLTEILPNASEQERAVRFIRAVLVASSKTYSHFDIIAKRYLDLLQEFVGKEPDAIPLALVAEVQRFWANGPQWADYVLDKLVAFEVLTTRQVVTSILEVTVESLDDLLAFEKAAVWEHLRSVFERVRTRAQTLKDEVAALAKFASSAPEGEMDKAADDLDRTRAELKSVNSTLEAIVYSAMRGLLNLYTSLRDIQVKDGISETSLTILEWRILGMIQEIARRNCQTMATQRMTQLVEESTPSKATELVTRVLDFSTSAMLLPD